MANPDIDLFEQIWESGLLVFDTSSLLRIYEWGIQNAIELKDVLKYKSNTIWIPHQVNSEVEKHKLGMEDVNKYQPIIDKIEATPTNWGKIRNMMRRWEGRGFEPEFTAMVFQLERDGLTDDKFQHLKDIAKQLRQEHRQTVAIDNIFEELFSNVGQPFSASEELKWISEFQQSPGAPGYKDRNKRNANSHGDYFIWKQMIKKSIESSQDIIFVTADVKEDWFSNRELQQPREDLMNDFYTETQHRLLITSLTTFLEQCSVYLNADLRELVAYSSIQDQVREVFDTWYPDQLLDKVNEYLEDDDTIKDEMESVLETCIDIVSFEGVTEHQFNLDDSDINIDDSVIIFHSYVDITADFDADAHFANEDFHLGTASVNLRVWIDIFVEKEWQSEDSNRISLRNQAENIEIIDIEFLGASGDGGPDDVQWWDSDDIDNEDDVQDYNHDDDYEDKF
ncbi:hypothetical protein AM501_09715 [Aneurinibacillus migulanus]|uniref:PIN-like domain-containing protein n=1 Tax=Aneurinibacillus migulanus TaxID=47500 RepID=UPI0005BAFB61|nr:PIN-like domain-containing protein [Aneurinibacillus migulanus]KIV56423.1 hypothetical protein TS64_09130 [Aneurinibacillus migulanus]KPD08431.1 hypothetical protein AM501_09715 [Aneurinibacillus migulanus]